MLSPAPTVFETVRAPHQQRRGVPAESYTSTPTTVAAGRPENVTVLLLEVVPADAAVKATVCRAYDPPVTSVPAAEADPFAVTRAARIGPVGAV
jgi:hypothetical protein